MFGMGGLGNITRKISEHQSLRYFQKMDDISKYKMVRGPQVEPDVCDFLVEKLNLEFVCGT